MSSSDEVTLRTFAEYWNLIVKEIKELKARVANTEARIDALDKPVEVSEPKEVPEEEAAEL